MRFCQKKEKRTHLSKILESLFAPNSCPIFDFEGQEHKKFEFEEKPVSVDLPTFAIHTKPGRTIRIYTFSVPREPETRIQNARSQKVHSIFRAVLQ